MAEKFYSLLTNIGKAKIANSIGLGTKVNFMIMKVGDGGGSYYEPTEDQADLKNTTWQGNINHVEIDNDNPSWLNIQVMIPSSVGGFTIREYGAFDEEGNMLGICKCAETYKPKIEDGSTKELLLNLTLAVTNTESVNLKIDPTIIFAKKSEIDQLRTDINAQLSDFVYQTAGGTSTSITLTMQTLVNGYFKTFIASANNNGAATTINGKKLYKPGTTTAPNLIAGKAYTVWYNQAGDCFFIKASAEGDAIAANVLAGKKFSNDNDTGLVGTLDLSNLVSGNIKSGVSINGVSGKASVVDTSDANALAGQILNGQTAYVNGNKVAGNMPNHSGADSPANSIAGTGAGRIYVRPQAGYYDGSVASYVDDGNYNPANIVSGKSILGLWEVQQLQVWVVLKLLVEL
ncbi:phage tail protein [Clostridium saccharoperbutylacetonicum]|uniref:phage tail protein n=1 Tax=Clostridium saccharoperbutylacetonicum TaxID=36745 RepID=UPI001F4D0C96|nr:phage tail protein [Clostridium saccharoperbutylacetonicum]NSB26132.1 phage-related tail fiber protein [Clostridium saccharoperbutylacetonicum]